MAFPTTGILDGGTSPVENPLSTGGWTGPLISGQQPGQRTATGIARGSATGGSYLPTNYGPDIEIYATINVLTAGTNTTEMYLYARTADAGTALIDGYAVNIRASSTASSDRIRVIRTDDSGVDVTLGTFVVGTFAVGDKYGMSIVGDNVTGWFCPVSTGVWTAQIGPVTDATYSAAGKFGFLTARSDTRIIDFGGGTIVTGQVILPDADTATTGWTTAPQFSKVNDSSDATVITATAS